MRFLDIPLNCKPISVYFKCVNSIQDKRDSDKFKCFIGYYQMYVLDYCTKAISKNLYLIPTHVMMKNITKQKMKTLYEQQMVQNKEGRKIYDKLISLAPLSRCPFCGIGTVGTLDHYLPKAKFPTFSVLPYNLVPSCIDCNKGKNTDYAVTQETQTLHPYYDDFTREQWLFAKVEHTSPVSISFFVETPNEWRDIDKSRVTEHLSQYKLAKRFSIQASNELANLKEEFTLFSLEQEEIKKELKKKAIVFQKRYLNSWESALYQALADSDWYCSGGYNEDT